VPKKWGDYELVLPYTIPRGKTKVFDDRAQLAIDIIEMFVDGEKIEPSTDMVIRETILGVDARRVVKGENEFKIVMAWNKSRYTGKLIWNGARSSLSYMISSGHKELRFRYKIVIPFLFFTAKKLRDGQIPKNSYSPEYEVIVNLENIIW
jgi:hypothetical protein